MQFKELKLWCMFLFNLHYKHAKKISPGQIRFVYQLWFFHRCWTTFKCTHKCLSNTSFIIFLDPLRTTQGFVALKAYRLTPKMMDFYRDGDFTPEAIQAASISFESMFEEIPVVVKNSHLVNALLCEVDECPKSREEETYNFLDLATRFVLWFFFGGTRMIV